MISQKLKDSLSKGFIGQREIVGAILYLADCIDELEKEMEQSKLKTKEDNK